jgi:nitrogen regulatory protein PII
LLFLLATHTKEVTQQRRTRWCKYRGAEYSVNFLPKVKIDVAIADDQLDEVIDVISKAAYTGKIGDGKIFVAELQRVIRIRTGEADEAAL